MPQIAFVAKVRDDFDRIFDHLFAHAPEYASTRIDAILKAVDVLATSPMIGRPVSFGQRELVISTGASGYLALYQYQPELDVVLVLGVRSQREAGYKR